MINWEWFGFNIKASNLKFSSALALALFWITFLHWLCYWWRFNQVKNDLLCWSIFCFIINLLSGWEWVYLVGKWTQSHFFWETLWWHGKPGKILLRKLEANRNRIFSLVRVLKKFISETLHQTSVWVWEEYWQLLASVSGALAHWPTKSFTRLYNFSIITYWKLERRGSVSSDWGFLFKLLRLKIDI